MIFNMLCIMVAIVLITDISGWPSTLNRLISRILTGGKLVTNQTNLKIVSCSFCQTWWCCLLYLIITHQLSIPMITVSLLLAFMTQPTMMLLLLCKDLINKLINTVYDRIIEK